MKRLLYASLFSLGCWAASSAPALAQLGIYQRPQVNPYPAVSPYLNMLNGGNAATNYFGIVKPQMQTAQSIQQLQQQYQMIQSNNLPLLGGSMVNQDNVPTTGHPVMFMNYGYYFPTIGGSGGTGGGGRSTGFKRR